MKSYEGIFVVDPELSEPDQEKVRESIEELIKKNQGTVDHVEKWGKRKLAFRLHKRHEGVYFVVRFTALQETVAKLEKADHLKESIIRSMIVVAEETQAAPATAVPVT